MKWNLHPRRHLRLHRHRLQVQARVLVLVVPRRLPRPVPRLPTHRLMKGLFQCVVLIMVEVN